MDKLLGLRKVIIATDKFCKYSIIVLLILHFFAFFVLDQVRVYIRRVDYFLNKQTNS